MTWRNPNHFPTVRATAPPLARTTTPGGDQLSPVVAGRPSCQRCQRSPQARRGLCEACLEHYDDMAADAALED